MKKLYAVLLALFATTAMSQTVLPIPDDARLIHQGNCTDNETGDYGFCQIGQTADGTNYVIFYQEGQPRFVRRVRVGEPYETIWSASPGTSL